MRMAKCILWIKEQRKGERTEQILINDLSICFFQVTVVGVDDSGFLGQYGSEVQGGAPIEL